MPFWMYGTDSANTAQFSTTTPNVWTWWNSGTATVSMGCASCLSEPCRCGTGAGLGGVTSGPGFNNGTAIWSSWTVTVGAMPAPPPILTPAQQVEQARLQREATEQQARELQRQREADARAEALLRDHLTVEQAAQWIQSNYFEVLTDSGRRYRVYRGGYVRRVDQGRETRSYCIHPSEFLPAADSGLAKKLLLDAAEPEFLRIANETVMAV